uniref:G-protein coupled receptors family 1 profile domain-containing protein n=1 Tax=Strongyloides stercoralis TaxID=6248 RepID=A0A0K0E3T0_STRER
MDKYENTFVHKVRLVMFYSNIIAEISGIFLNSLLIGIILTISNKEFKNYRRILLTTAIFDITFSLFTAFTCLSMEPANKYFVTWAHGIVRSFPTSIRLIIVITIIGSFYITVSNTAIVFYYRYLIIVKEKIMSNWHYFILMVINILWNILGAGIWAWAFLISPEEAHKEVINTLGEEYFHNFDGTITDFFILQPLSIAGMSGLGHNTITCTIVVLTVFKTYRDIQVSLKNKSTKMSNKSKNLQKQLNRTMMLQALTPLFLCVIPVLTMVMCCFLKILLYGFSSLFFITFMFVPAFNALICLICVKVCRRKITGFFFKENVVTSNSRIS